MNLFRKGNMAVAVAPHLLSENSFRAVNTDSDWRALSLHRVAKNNRPSALYSVTSCKASSAELKAAFKVV